MKHKSNFLKEVLVLSLLLFRLANEVGIGIGLFGNINPENIFGGLQANITLGNGK